MSFTGLRTSFLGYIKNRKLRGCAMRVLSRKRAAPFAGSKKAQIRAHDAKDVHRLPQQGATPQRVPLPTIQATGRVPQGRRERTPVDCRRSIISSNKTPPPYPNSEKKARRFLCRRAFSFPEPGPPGPSWRIPSTTQSRGFCHSETSRKRPQSCPTYCKWSSKRPDISGTRDYPAQGL